MLLVILPVLYELLIVIVSLALSIKPDAYTLPCTLALLITFSKVTLFPKAIIPDVLLFLWLILYFRLDKLNVVSLVDEYLNSSKEWKKDVYYNLPRFIREILKKIIGV